LAEPQPKSNLVHFSLKTCHLVSGYTVGLQHAVKKYWYRGGAVWYMYQAEWKQHAN